MLSASLGLCIQHDANHGALSSSPFVNRIFGFCDDLIGGSGLCWRHQVFLDFDFFFFFLLYEQDNSKKRSNRNKGEEEKKSFLRRKKKKKKKKKRKKKKKKEKEIKEN